MNAPVTNLLNTLLAYQEQRAQQACSWCGEVHPMTEMVMVENDYDTDWYCSIEHMGQDLTEGRGRR